MSNPYCTQAQFTAFADVRSLGMLSNDDGSRSANAATIQTLLDAAASELDSHLATWASLPLTVTPLPSVLTRWVATKAKVLAYQRRTERPKSLDAEIEWLDDWITKWDEGQIVLPGVSRVTQQLHLTDARARHLSRPVYGLLTGYPYDEGCYST